jgi:tetratricopeptide (TPR) repeat protein
LAAKNAELAEEQAKVEARNRDLADEQAKVQARFELAQKAIATFHTGVSEDTLLKNEQFNELRTKLLKEAADFYADLEKLLSGETDAQSRKALAAAYFQLGELTDKIASKPEALAVHRKALALRRELAAAPGADVETRLNVARSLRVEGILLIVTGDRTGALKAWEEQRDIATALEAESPTDAVRAVLGQSHNSIGALLIGTGKPVEALKAYQEALAIRQKLADAHPAVAQFQSDLALSYNNIGLAFLRMGKPEEALKSCGKALPIYQRLSETHAADKGFQSELAKCHFSMGVLLAKMGKPKEAVEAHRQALAIRQRLVAANAAVAGYQNDLAWSHIELGLVLARRQRFAEGFAAINAGLSIRQKLAGADPKNTEYVSDLGYGYAYRGTAVVQSASADRGSKAARDLRMAVELWDRARSPNPETHFERSRALALLAGLADDGASGVSREEAARCADRSIAALRDAINAGYDWPSQLKEPDFNPLRSRDDFKKLLAELDAKSGRRH